MMQVSEPLCTGCGVCVELCPSAAIHLQRGIAVIDQAKCSKCEVCLEACPQGAIFGVSERTEESVSLPARQPMPETIQVQSPQVEVARPVASPLAARGSGVLPALAGVVALVGRELPRILPSLLDALERRTTTQPPAANYTPSQQSVTRRNGVAGQRRRRRRRGGR